MTIESKAATATPTAPTESLERLATALGVRALHTVCDEILTEGGSAPSHPLRQASAMAVVRNPWLDTDTTEDLESHTRRVAPVLAKLLSDRLLKALGGADQVQTFGKAAIVGLHGEVEHGGALIHTPYFGNLVREFLQGSSIICFTDGRATAGSQVRVPMWHKTHAASRAHYQAMEVHLPDAPHADEICVIAVASSGPRPHARIGDRTTDEVITSDILKGITP
ncbi:amino acid synthesis family protein [Citricoccus sp.]|uniref:amino acid synthesis family protein n=1 Tax=Citricoccus sp. TaxID=1978372 RepID=UPI00262F505F|nr:amino acid synthesis family protein [Citricoccus sp.]HRO29792.1 amino acid synthesis family protein [Citricoccus sp.]HRO94136.1 amino acid synthesis family protein [Citricoccus sp.]